MFLFFACMLVLILAVPAEAAQPSSVLLYPSGGFIQVDTQIKVESGRIAFDLPADAQISTLSMTISDVPVSGWNIVPAPPRPDSPVVAEIRSRLTAARAAEAAINGEMAGAQARIRLWSHPQQKESSLENLEKLDASIAGRLKSLYSEVADIAPRQQATAREVSRLEKELIAAGGRSDGLGNDKTPVPDFGEDIRVSVSVPAELVKSPDGMVAVHYSCILTNCGWQPVYTLNAQPEKKKVHFVQEAEIRQSTGQDWAAVPLKLASMDLGTDLEPAPLRDWRLKPAQAASGARARSAVPYNMTMESVSSDAAGVAPIAMIRKNADIQEQESATVWDSGKQDIPAGRKVRLSLAESDWDASFVRVARPAQRKNAWIMAEVTLPAPAIFPNGAARYLVDGISVGNAGFTLAGSKEKIYFGPDPHVYAEMKLDTRKSGKTGIVSKQQTRIWDWTIEVSNHHSTPIAVRVEDPEPQSGDTGIIVKTTAMPSPAIEDHVTVWQLDIPAGKTKNISYTVEVSAPSDMHLVDGR